MKKRTFNEDHETHFACDKQLQKHGGLTSCCYCEGHYCVDEMKNQNNKQQEEWEIAYDALWDIDGKSYERIKSFIRLLLAKH